MERDILGELKHSLPVSRRHRTAIIREMTAHVEETAHDLQLEGWRPEDAQREAEARLGNTQEIAAAFGDAYRPRRRTQLGLALALASGMLLGGYGVVGTLASANAKAAHHPARVAKLHPATHQTTAGHCPNAAH